MIVNLFPFGSKHICFPCTLSLIHIRLSCIVHPAHLPFAATIHASYWSFCRRRLHQFLRDAIKRSFSRSFISTSPSFVPNVSQTPSLSPTCTSLPLQKLPSMQQTPLTNTLTNLSSLVIPIRAYMHGIPVCCCADLASRNTQVLVFLDAAAEEVCGDSCATHCEVCGWCVWFGFGWKRWRWETGWLLALVSVVVGETVDGVG
jgi:hypothetical protein